MKVILSQDANGGWYWAVKRKGRKTATGAGNDQGNGFANKANAIRSFNAHRDHILEEGLDPVEFVDE